MLAAIVIWRSAFHLGVSLEALADLPFTWVACGVLLLGLRRDHARFEATGQTKARGILPFYGYISYGLYLINVLVYTKLGGFIWRHVSVETLNNFFNYAGLVFCCIAVSTTLAFLSRRFFEGPLLSLKDKWQDRFAQPTAPPPAPAIAIRE